MNSADGERIKFIHGETGKYIVTVTNAGSVNLHA
ncbi:hypothetical protein EQG78_07205 [Citrobacter freundii]|nr:hypothetical protein [Citrobacter freundii]